MPQGRTLNTATIAADSITRCFVPGETVALFLRLTVEKQESALKMLAITFGGDPACTDCNRVLRLPGFLTCNYDPAYPVTVEYPGDSTWNSDEFRLDMLAADALVSSCSITSRKHSDRHSNSERDWVYVLHELVLGKDAGKLRPKLARAARISRILCTGAADRGCRSQTWAHRTRSDRRCCHDAAGPRCFEIPIALCSAPARELALEGAKNDSLENDCLI